MGVGVQRRAPAALPPGKTRHLLYRSTRWRSWLRHFATSRKFSSSIPGVVVGMFHWHNSSGRNMALGSKWYLTKMSTRNILGGKDGRCVRLTTLPPSCADCLEIWRPQLPENLRACPGLYRDCFTFTDRSAPHYVAFFTPLLLHPS
jgi:hypothetical protein